MTGLDAVEVAEQIEALIVSGSFGGTLTYKGEGVTATDGFWVGGEARGIQMPIVPISRYEIFMSIYRWLLSLLEEDIYPQFVGYWVEDNILYVDVCTYVQSREEAIELGKVRGEIAIYDIDQQESVYV